MRSDTLPRSVNLSALESRFFSTCCSRLMSVVIGARNVGTDFDRELQVLAVGHVPEVALDVVAQLGEPELARLHLHRAGFDLARDPECR